ncbi:MAG: hypothetical protein IPK78_09515 [Rhodospirillales bacterium]|nr:hypothetical protein [Rhodospirillales bacterium]
MISGWMPAAMVAASAGLAPVAAAADEPPPADVDAAMHGSFNNGEDITRPRTLFQVRQRYQRLPDDNGHEPEKWITTLRADLWTGLGDGWKLYGRVDQPLVYSNDVTSSFNPNGHSRFGQSDLLTEIAIIGPPPTARVGYGAGVRAVWPTAGLNEAGSGKYQIGPVVGFRSSLPEISPGSFFPPQVIYLNSIASRNQNSGRADVNQLSIQPKFNVALPDDWFLTAYASENIQINYGDDGKLFLPLDLMVGKKLFDRIVASLEYSRQLIHEKGFEPYQWQLEGRIGYYF